MEERDKKVEEVYLAMQVYGFRPVYRKGEEIYILARIIEWLIREHAIFVCVEPDFSVSLWRIYKGLSEEGIEEKSFDEIKGFDNLGDRDTYREAQIEGIKAVAEFFKES